MKHESFRNTWEPLCDHLLTTPRQIVSWYEGPLRRLRLVYYPATRELKLSVVEGAHWRFLELYYWPEFTPAEIAHRARAVLLAERDKRFPEKPALVVTPIPGCRGRLRTVAR
jgi:hypothetical protein